MILIGNAQCLGRSNRCGRLDCGLLHLGEVGKLIPSPQKRKKKKTATVEQNTCLLPYLPVLYSYSISVEGQYSVPFFVQEGEEKETHTHTHRGRGREVSVLAPTVRKGSQTAKTQRIHPSRVPIGEILPFYYGLPA